VKVCRWVSSSSNLATQRHTLDCKCVTSLLLSENMRINYKWSNCTNMKLHNEIVFPAEVSSLTFYSGLRQRVRTGVNISVYLE
jgi:hypothetical protein